MNILKKRRSMTIRKRSATTSIGLAVVIATASLSSFAQDPAAKKATDKPEATTVVKKKYDPSRRVPDYFGQIGLTIEQRESIYKVRKVHHEKLEALKKQIVEEDADAMKKCEVLLTDTQKKLLDHLRTEGIRAPLKAVEPIAKK
jgi:hypothetical protein